MSKKDKKDYEDIGEHIISETEYERWFVAEVKYWVNKFGLTEWELRFELQEDNENEAFLIHDVETGDATFVLSNQWELKNFSEKAIRLAAFHEVQELILVPLREMAEDRNFNDKDYTKETHRIIRRFENSIFKSRWKKLVSKRK